MGNDTQYLKHFISEEGSDGYVTPADGTKVQFQGLRVGAPGGDVAIMNKAGNIQVWDACPVGYIIPAWVQEVRATDTTIGLNIIGL